MDLKVTLTPEESAEIIHAMRGKPCSGDCVVCMRRQAICAKLRQAMREARLAQANQRNPAREQS